MKLKEIESKKTEIEKEVLKTEQQLDTLVVEIATLEAQIKSKNRKVMDLTEQISSKRSELRKLEIAKEIILTPAQSESEEEELEKPQKYEGFKANHKYIKGDRFKESNRLYEVVYDHTSDEKFNKLATNKYQLIDEDTGKPIFNYSVLKNYNKFEKCLSDDHIYSSKIDKNGTSPITNPENWFKID
jgi:hypothetical protein